MASYNTLSADQMERIVMLSTHFSSGEAATILGFSDSTIRKVWLAYETAKSGDIEKMRAIQVSEPVRAWAAAKFNLDLSQENRTPPKEEKPTDNTAEAFMKLMSALGELHKDLSRAIGALTNMESTIKAENEQMRQLVNANTDIVCNFIKDQKDILNGIKANTRPRRDA